MLKQLIFVTLLALAVACGSKPSESEDDIEWAEMDEFHMVMADVYHPLKDSGNLEPIRKNADQLATAAKKWADAKVPSKVDNEEMKGILQKLKDGTQDLSDKITSGATDDQVSAQLTDLHEIFHHAQEQWYSAGSEEGAEGHKDDHHEH